MRSASASSPPCERSTSTRPSVDIQRDLARLRRSYVMTGFVVGLPWWLLWIPLVMLVFGVDLVTFGSPTWLVVNVAIGVVGIAGTLW